MNPLLLACLVACFVGALAPVVHSQGPSEDCCLAYHPHARWAVLRHAQGYTRQEVSGSCNLPAVIFFFPRRHKMVCGNPQDMWVQNGMRRLDARRKISKFPKNSWKTLQGLRSPPSPGPGNTRGTELFWHDHCPVVLAAPVPHHPGTCVVPVLYPATSCPLGGWKKGPALV